MSFEEQLTQQLLQAGALPNSFSINHPKNYRLNLQENPDMSWSVWFQDDGGRYEQKTYDNKGEAVYNFATRLVSTQAADQLAKEYGDPDLKVYSH